MIYGILYTYLKPKCYHACAAKNSPKPSDNATQRKSTGGMKPRKQIACRPGDFHKRTRETSSNSNSDSGLGFKQQFFVHLYSIYYTPGLIFSAIRL